MIRRWRSTLPREIWYEEISNLSPKLRAILPVQWDVDDAQHFFRTLGEKVAKNEGLQGIAPWFRRVMSRIDDATWQDPDLQVDLHRLWWLTERENPIAKPPPGFDPASIPVDKEQQTKLFNVSQTGKHMLISEVTTQRSLPFHSPIAQIRTRNGQIKIGPDEGPLALDCNSFWKTSKAPDWASDWGEDRYGKWVEFSIDGHEGKGVVVQRMRWIAPGRFVMGSPEDEPGRYSAEGPQHEVTLTCGYWLFDTPVTQALYEAVTEQNPSYFKSPQRPVEHMSWHDAQDFIQQLNVKIPSLRLSLPTEAQWENACRAGTITATYVGAMAILGERNAPILDKIAWYGGNSGVKFDLKEGVSSSGWEEKQHSHAQAGTRNVAQKQANSLGLYDMLGNVWEWCEDGLRQYTHELIVNPVGPQKEDVDRVLRGGSWNGSAGYVRCASRVALASGHTTARTGFRCVLVNAPDTADEAEPSETLARTGGARLVDCSAVSEGQSIDWPRYDHFVIHSDREKRHVQQFSKPEWAHAIGRDQHGLWVSIKVISEQGAPVIQKMRWIPPGRFLMGSPKNEPGRRKNEGPQHEVTLTRGYWLFDTPVTQALHEAVSGKNPSRFQSPQRPVERVSWHDAQTFMQRMNETIPDLDLSLPTEAQWEYAARAGTTAATYAGAIEILGQRNAPVLDAIAWYGGNSGVAFDLDKGHDSSGWKEKQYGHQKAGTRNVAQKQANPWGLYDMLGNVWEWCADGRCEYSKGSAIDPVGTQEDGTVRVLRGGSWYNLAGGVRCACRRAGLPEDADYDIGFRCARVHVPESGSERRGRPLDRVAEQRDVDGHVGGDQGAS